MNNIIVHHGIKGMHWGVRRFQNYDGTRITTARSRANRAKEEAETAKKLARKYTSAMDRKAAKRQAQADSATRFKSTKQNKADRAKEEAETAKKLAKSYTDAMDRKAEKREAAAIKSENKTSIKEKIKTTAAKNKSNSVYTKSKSMSDEELRKSINRMKLEREYRDLKSEDNLAGKVACSKIIGDYGGMFIKTSTTEFTKDLATNTGRKMSRKIVPQQKKK